MNFKLLRARFVGSSSISGWILFGFFSYLLFWFRLYLSDQAIASWDLPGHISIVERLADQLLHGNLRFYDPTWFSGWPAFSFYAFLSHLLTAVLSLPLRLFSEEPARLAVHLFLAFGAALLPLSMFLMLKPLACRLCNEKTEQFAALEWTLAASCGAWSFFFLNHDHQWYGIGAAAPMNVGLYSQIFAWHFFFLHLSAVFHLLEKDTPGQRAVTAMSFALLFLAHTLTAAFDLALVGLAVLWYAERRRALVQSHAIGLGLCAFWLVPFLDFSGTYTTLDIYRPTGDFLELFFRYPWNQLLAMPGVWLSGSFPAFDWHYPAIMLLTVVFLGSRRMRSAENVIVFAVFHLVILLCVSSGYVASSLPIGFHYYRFLAYVFLFFVALLALVSFSMTIGLLSSLQVWKRNLGYALVLFWVSASVGATTSLPHYERNRVAANSGPNYLRNENAVLMHFATLQDKGRVFFEYFTDEARFAYLGVHYLESRLPKVSGFETMNGLFIQSSLAYRMAVVSANLLGAKSYNVPLLFTDGARLESTRLVEQLREFGITHVVCGDGEFFRKVQPYAQGEVVRIGPYRIIHIVPQTFPKVLPVRKVPLGFFESSKDLPFQMLEYYFYSRSELSSPFELLLIESGKKLPESIPAILVNGDVGRQELERQLRAQGKLGQVEILQLDFELETMVQHYSVRYQHNVELDHYNEVERYLNLSPEIQELAKFDVEISDEEENLAPQFEWRNAEQGIRVSGLVPGRLYRLNYSYFPYWQATGAELLRGSGERIYLLPSESTAELSYQVGSAGSTWLGWLFTLGALGWVLNVQREVFRKA